MPEPHAAPARATFRQKLGPGGTSSLALALGLGALALGIPVAWCLRCVLQAARGGAPVPADAILVLGRRLERNHPTEVFRKRLAHAAALWRQGLAPVLIVAGGVTGDARRSEAEAGRAWLLEQGIPGESVLIEDRSQHTLENLFNVRVHLQAEGWKTLILVSDPLHLARALALAQGLGLAVSGAPAHACPPRPGCPSWWLRALREAFLLHWYRTGAAYSRLIRSEAQLARIT